MLPDAATLRGPEARHQFIAETTDSGRQEDATASATWKSSNPSVATVTAAGLVTPVSDGDVTITAEVAGQSSAARIHVTAAKEPFQWTFKNDVLPVMTKVGCNQGACHGALAGKGGFKLTLRGYDPDADYDTLTRQSLGRRVLLSDPSHSLMLLKPTMAIGHGGGQRFKPDSLEYRIISQWIAAGAPAPQDSDPAVIGLEVFPAKATLQINAGQQLVVRARYADGNVRDVTRWVKFSSSDEGVATVDDLGHVKMNGPGEAAITLWYQSRVSYARLAVPFDNKIDPSLYTRFQRRNYIDDFVIEKLKALNIAPSKPADDATFLRRAYLDAAGILPSSRRWKRSLPTPLRTSARR